jgi:hypothetical protein
MLKKLFSSKNKNDSQKSIIITFHTTYDTMNLNEHFNKAAIKGRLIPVPRSLSSSCGIAWQGNIDDEEIIKKQIDKDNLEIESFNIM